MSMSGQKRPASAAPGGGTATGQGSAVSPTKSMTGLSANKAGRAELMPKKPKKPVE